ncbi:TPA: ATP-binding protein, partial [Campylobacter upsaliensis]|nr:ATP-binding protein [Campylobacter upsaliensis]
SPTLDIDLIKLRAKKILPKALELGIFHIVFITLSSEESFFEQGVKFEILPFDKWALSL